MFFLKKKPGKQEEVLGAEVIASPAKKATPRRSLTEDFLNLILKIMVLIVLFWFLLTFIFGLRRITESGMAPSIKAEDLIMYYRLDKEYNVLDPVVIEVNGEVQVRRVMAKAGDTVDISDEGLIVNGSLQKGLEGDFVKGETLPYTEGISYPVTLKKGEIFVLGDNREAAQDSRIFGPIKEKDTLGTLMWTLRRKNL